MIRQTHKPQEARDKPRVLSTTSKNRLCFKCGKNRGYIFKRGKYYCKECYNKILYVRHNNLDSKDIEVTFKHDFDSTFLGYITHYNNKYLPKDIIRKDVTINVSVQKLLRYSKEYFLDFNERFAKTITHEYIHFILLKLFGGKMCKQFDNIANNELKDYEVF